jgi:hypothetical protein
VSDAKMLLLQNRVQAHSENVDTANRGKANLKHGKRSKKVIEQHRKDRITFKYIADALQIGLHDDGGGVFSKLAIRMS